MRAIALRCHEPQCRRPWAYIYNGVLTVESRHEGQKHTNAISFGVLLRLLRHSRHTLSEAEMREMLDELAVPTVEPVLADVHSQGDDTGSVDRRHIIE